MMEPAASVTTTASPTALRSCRRSSVSATVSIAISITLSAHAFGVHLGDLLGAVAETRQDFVRMLAKQRRAGDLGLEVRELDRAADGQVVATLLVRHFHDRAAGAQRRIVR